LRDDGGLLAAGAASVGGAAATPGLPSVAGGVAAVGAPGCGRGGGAAGGAAGGGVGAAVVPPAGRAPRAGPASDAGRRPLPSAGGGGDVSDGASAVTGPRDDVAGGPPGALLPVVVSFASASASARARLSSFPSTTTYPATSPVDGSSRAAAVADGTAPGAGPHAASATVVGPRGEAVVVGLAGMVDRHVVLDLVA